MHQFGLLKDCTEKCSQQNIKKVECFIYLCIEGKIMVMDFSLHIKNVHLYVCSFNFYINPLYGLRDRTFSLLQSLASFSDTFQKTIILKITTVFFFTKIRYT